MQHHSRSRSEGIHPDRTAGRHRHHRRPDRPALAGRPGGPRGGAAAQCTNNMKQLALACHNYESANGTFPMGRNNQAYISTGGGPQGYHDGWGQFGALLLFTEQSAVYNAINITLGPYQLRNSTFPGIGIRRPSGAPATRRSTACGSSSSRPAGMARRSASATPAIGASAGRSCPAWPIPRPSCRPMQGMFPDTAAMAWYNPGQSGPGAR